MLRPSLVLFAPLLALLPGCKNITIQSLGAPCGELVDAECGDSLSCVGATDTSAGICRALCSANADCAGQGGVCFVSGVGMNQSVCRTPSESSCSSDRDCPIGTVCRMGDGCLAACNVATDCGPSGFECRGNACYPAGGGVVGGPATVTLYTGLVDATELLVVQLRTGETAVYWIEQAGTALRRALADGIQTVATGTRLAQLRAEPGAPAHVYFVDGVNIRRVANDAEATVEDFATNQSISRLVIAGRPAAAFWTTNFEPGIQNEVRTLPLDMPLGTPTAVPGTTETTGTLGALAVDDRGAVYWAVNTMGRRLRSTEGLDLAVPGDVWDLAVSGGVPYFAQGGGDTDPYCVVTEGAFCQAQAVEAGGPADPPRLLLGTVGSNDLVLLAPRAGRVTRARVSGPATDPQLVGANQARPSSASVHQGRVYWLNTGGDGGAIVAEEVAE